MNMTETKFLENKLTCVGGVHADSGLCRESDIGKVILIEQRLWTAETRVYAIFQLQSMEAKQLLKYERNTKKWDVKFYE